MKRQIALFFAVGLLLFVALAEAQGPPMSSPGDAQLTEERVMASYGVCVLQRDLLNQRLAAKDSEIKALKDQIAQSAKLKESN